MGAARVNGMPFGTRGNVMPIPFVDSGEAILSRNALPVEKFPPKNLGRTVITSVSAGDKIKEAFAPWRGCLFGLWV